jgi:hypothetical protein
MENIQLNNSNYDFLVPLCLYLVQKYEKNAIANDKCVFATCTEFMFQIYLEKKFFRFY